MEKKEKYNDSRKKEKKLEEYWTKHGVEDVYFQRESQVTFWSIMGGISAGALLTQFFPLIEQVQSGHWYVILYFFASLFILITGWVQTVWGTLVVKWRIQFPTIIPHFMTLFCTAILCLLVTKPAGWALSAGGVLFFDLLHQQAFRLTGGWENFSENRVKFINRTLIIYFILMLICLFLAVFLFFYPTNLFEMSAGIFFLLSTFTAIVLQHVGMKKEREEFGIP